MCYVSNIFLYFHWDFDNRHYFYEKGTFIDFFKSSPSARLYLEVLATMIPRLNLKTVCVGSLLCNISFCFLYSSIFSRKKWLSYLSHAILYFFVCNFTSHGICINFDNQQVYYLVNLYFFVACVGQPESVLTRYLRTLLGFQIYELFAARQGGFIVPYVQQFSKVATFLDFILLIWLSFPKIETKNFNLY